MDDPPPPPLSPSSPSSSSSSLPPLIINTINNNTPHHQLMKLINHPELRAGFRSFLEKQVASENLDFFLEVELLRSIPPSSSSSGGESSSNSLSPQQIWEKCVHIYDTYLKEGAPAEINLDFDLKEDIRIKLSSYSSSFPSSSATLSILSPTSPTSPGEGQPPPPADPAPADPTSPPVCIDVTLFDAAQKYIFLLMQNDLLKKFFHHQIFKDLTIGPVMKQNFVSIHKTLKRPSADGPTSSITLSSISLPNPNPTNSPTVTLSLTINPSASTSPSSPKWIRRFVQLFTKHLGFFEEPLDEAPVDGIRFENVISIEDLGGQPFEGKENCLQIVAIYQENQCLSLTPRMEGRRRGNSSTQKPVRTDQSQPAGEGAGGTSTATSLSSLPPPPTIAPATPTPGSGEGASEQLQQLVQFALSFPTENDKNEWLEGMTYFWQRRGPKNQSFSNQTSSASSDLSEEESDEEEFFDPAEDEQILMKGYLTKEGGKVKNWKKRFFILRKKLLYYYKTEQDTVPLGIIPLTGAKVIDSLSADGKIFSFKLVSTVRTFDFKCDSYLQKEKWVATLKRVIAMGSHTVSQDKRITGGGASPSPGSPMVPTATPSGVGKVFKEGYLSKVGYNFKSVKVRWFVLNCNILSYFKNKEDPKPINTIILDYSYLFLNETNPQSFYLCTPNRTFNLTADSEEIMSEWISVLLPTLKPTTMMEFFATPKKKGFLYKEGLNNVSPKKRWFLLKSDLFYFKTNTDTSPTGVIFLQDIKIQEVKPSEDLQHYFKFCFQIKTPIRSYTIYAESKSELQEWLEAISNESKSRMN